MNQSHCVPSSIAAEAFVVWSKPSLPVSQAQRQILEDSMDYRDISILRRITRNTMEQYKHYWCDAHKASQALCLVKTVPYMRFAGERLPLEMAGHIMEFACADMQESLQSWFASTTRIFNAPPVLRHVNGDYALPMNACQALLTSYADDELELLGIINEKLVDLTHCLEDLHQRRGNAYQRAFGS